MRVIAALVLAVCVALTGCTAVNSLFRRDQPAMASSLEEESADEAPAASSVPPAPVSKPAPKIAPKAVAAVATKTTPTAPTPVSVPNVPSSFLSLQPFKQFVKGEGLGVARHYKSRTKAQVVALLRNKKLWEKEMRVSCEVWVRQIAEVRNIPFEGCEGAAAEIERNPDFAIEPCRDEMFQKNNWLTVNNDKGSTFNVHHRKCIPGEPVLVYKKQPLASTMCFNVAIPVTTLAPPPAVSAPPVALVPKAPTAPASCTDKRYFLEFRAYSEKDLPENLRIQEQALVAAANRRDSRDSRPHANADGTKGTKNAQMYKADDVSRTMGKALYYGAAPAGSFDVKVILLDPKTFDPSEDLGTVTLASGVFRTTLTEAQHLKIIKAVWPEPFKSPTVSDGVPQNWTFVDEWGAGLCPLLVVSGIFLP